MSISPMKTPLSVRIGADSGTSTLSFTAQMGVLDTPSVGGPGLLPSAFTLTPPPTTLPRRRSDDSFQRLKRSRQFGDSQSDEDEEARENARAQAQNRHMGTPTRPALTLASPSSTNLTSPAGKRPRLGRSISMGAALHFHQDEQFAFTEPPATMMAHTLSAPPMPIQTITQTERSAKDIPAYEAYLARQRRDSTDDGNTVWSTEVEDAFMQAIRMIPKVGRRKITVHGRACGRNELISDFIFRKTGKQRTRKQVSSHIQVLKHLLKDDAEFMDLVSDSPSARDLNMQLVYHDADLSPTESQPPAESDHKIELEVDSLPQMSRPQTVPPLPQHMQHRVEQPRRTSMPQEHIMNFKPQQDHELITPAPRQQMQFAHPMMVGHPSPLHGTSSPADSRLESPLETHIQHDLIYDMAGVYLSPTTETVIGAPITDVNSMMYMPERTQLPRASQHDVTTYIADPAQQVHPLGMWVECDPIAEGNGQLYSPNDLLEIWP
ncbi:TEA/ATTS domain family-domain-containing protein [Lipomyces arxii]|uniref:TEA/ATTS domain family-domain-containing protein n=1 Tax=Lipomyces arxii TaxID=56418 RepID=UPI0034CEB1ED